MGSTRTQARETLGTSLSRRMTTWTVARAIHELGLVLPSPLAAEISYLARVDRYGHSWRAAMHDDFHRPVAAERQVATYAKLFPDHAIIPPPDPSNADALDALVYFGLYELGVDSESAEQALVDRRWSTQAERKRLRFLARLERRAARLRDAWRLRHAEMQAKSRLAYLIDPDRCDDLTLAFCAYFAARANRRSEFQVGPQSRARDVIVDGLLELMQRRAAHTCAWDQVALVMPTPFVLAQCGPDVRGRLIGTFHAAMVDAALALRDLYGRLPQRMRAEMVMVKGVDSSRWNAYAGALNAMRSAWLNASLASGIDPRDGYLPGKAARLMASDLAWWYRSTGQDLHEDTTLFSALPKPWEVVLDGVRLDRERVERVAREHGVDVSTGWVGPRRGEEPEAPQAEPALVHGVAVADPHLAVTLRRCGVFSGGETRFIDDLPDELVRVTKFDGKRLTAPVVGALAMRERSRWR